MKKKIILKFNKQRSYSLYILLSDIVINSLILYQKYMEDIRATFLPIYISEYLYEKYKCTNHYNYIKTLYIKLKSDGKYLVSIKICIKHEMNENIMDEYFVINITKVFKSENLYAPRKIIITY